ncbi:hypothetical protein CC1G_07114 [Coprinopsis cinerea okayama7|uniref:Uncharacterized protein n=1 Tax=Coprinopsis cinerea (strain Okayama-7 / 130 / ATCC MYA-4618 / FGSC 9003) TaxID=240176 RepID=A8NUI6_COPC7|nr:hypothetical protein CC1G_07114 [Coprinopsis cinerea okayama7\|eukprot:XP_001836467.2 hypothetical protein CC1G_07114 [Coprinopsis cinerea okayama7\
MPANNPFVNANDPTHASSRFPDISGGSTSYLNPNQQPPQGQWMNNGNMSYQQPAYTAQYQQQQPQQQQYPQQSYGGGGYMSPTGMPQGQYGGGSTGQFQPSSSFGQQLSAHMSGTNYGYLNGQQTGVPQQQQQLGPAQAQIANNPGYVAQFDPYGPLSQWDGTSGQQQQQQQQMQMQQQQQQQYQQQQSYQTGYNDGSYLISPVGPTSGVSPTGEPHPREFIRLHKAQLDKWDAVAWKQLLNTFEALKKAWEARKTACSNQLQSLKSQLNFAGYYQQQVQAEIARVEQLTKEADSMADSVAASTFQMQEVFSGYRQSGDSSSKMRVREATNAAVRSLPDWPPSNI